MEKQIVTAARYRFGEKYYVEVCEEVASTGERDYWLCMDNSTQKTFLCTGIYRDRISEEDLIIRNVRAFFNNKKYATA